MIIDSHCHLDFEPISNSLVEVLDRASTEGVEYMLTISVKDNAFKNILDITKRFKQVYGTYGIHPHEASSHLHINCAEIIKKINLSNKIIGIGETGLDFYYNNSDKKSQIFLFKEHIKAAQETNLPLIVHTRSAENETIEIISSMLKIKKFKVLIHCFTGTKVFADKLIELGCYISASGIITFKKSNELANTFKSIPNDKILIETDSPYLAPVPLRGKSNEPSYIIHTLKHLSQLKNVDHIEFSKQIAKNFFNLFGELN